MISYTMLNNWLRAKRREFYVIFFHIKTHLKLLERMEKYKNKTLLSTYKKFI